MMTSRRTDVAGRSSGGFGAALGCLLLLGLVIQVVKLLVIPLTILAIGAVVIVPIYLFTNSRRHPAVPLPAEEPKASPENDGIVSQEAILQILPTDVAAEFTYQETQAVPVPAAPPNPTASSCPAAGHGEVIRAAGYRHGSCSVRHRTYEAAARCRNR
jgi:hypothetical protein